MTSYLFFTLVAASQATLTVTEEICSKPASGSILLQRGLKSNTAVLASRPKVKVTGAVKGAGIFDGYMTSDPAQADLPSDHSEGTLSMTSCGVPVHVDQTYDISARCPEECPFFAAKTDEEFCTFVCAAADECRVYDSSAPIADKNSWSCRAASVQGCREPSVDGTDTCAKCDSGYSLGEDGDCYLKYWKEMVAGGVIFGVLLLVVIYYAFELNLRPITNAEGLKEALSFRSEQKYRTPANPNGTGRELWPLTTNLCKEDIGGGPGLCLHFRFQAVLVIWALVVGLSWIAVSYATDTDLLILGRRPVGTAFRNCILVAWGHDRQQSLMWIKLAFLGALYVASFIGSLLLGIMQLRFYQSKDFQRDTMKDFAALITGLPEVSGSSPLEQELSRVVSESCGQKVIGVSVCWDFRTCQEQIFAQAQQRATSISSRPIQTGEEEMGFLRKRLFKLEQWVLDEEEQEELSEGDAQELMSSLKSSTQAFVVFETEKARDCAVAAVKHGFQFRSRQLRMEASHVEPEAIYWQNFDNSSNLVKSTRLFKGCLCIILGLTAWACVFYLPYAWSIFTFNYTGGRMPGTAYSLLFSMIVVIGNLTMVEICTRVSDSVGFRFKDTRELCYMILYLIAVSMNIALDIYTTYFMSEQIMVNLEFRTWDGLLLPEVPHFTDEFEAYAMQRSMGQNMYEYAWPATFLVPFICEPMFAIYMLMRVFLLLVRTHPELKPNLAKSWLAAVDMELGRYADCLLNVVVAVLVLFFPGGYTHLTFIFMAVSHVWIYVLDHLRVLRVVPAAVFSGMDTDWWAQAVLAPCCGLILACLVFKGNCSDYGYCYEGPALHEACIWVGLCHSVVHLLLLVYLVPIFGLDACRGELYGKRTYKDIAQETPCTWFSANPVHCLRSKYVFKDSPCCNFYSVGEEKHLQVNEKIGCFYRGAKHSVENVESYELHAEPFLTWLPTMVRGLFGGSNEMKQELIAEAG